MSASAISERSSRVAALPPGVILTGVAALAMLVPGVFALVVGDPGGARAFLASAGLTLALAAMLAMAMSNDRGARPAGSYLATLLGAYVLLPVLLAVPFHQSVGNTRFLNAYVEMVSSMTTTGATLFPGAERLSDAEHLWRALVGWLGGFFLWVGAIAILAPLNLGGFDVLAPQHARREGPDAKVIARVADPATRLQRFAARLAPVYLGLSLVLWVSLQIAGDRPLVALIHAMATMSTSGIAHPGSADGAGRTGEVIVLLFMVFALTRRSFARDRRDTYLSGLAGDPELRLGLTLVAGVTALLFLRHWLGALEVRTAGDLATALAALWGAFFTTASFLTTTGFVSADWQVAQSWSGLETPGLLLMGLALFGGGVATTAGGVKLLRIYALWMHGRRELERLVHPSSVGGEGTRVRRIRREGAYMAWIFFMLFALSIAALMLAFSLAGLDFEATVVLTIAGMATTGPLLEVAGAAPLILASLGDGAKLVLAAAMVLGRLETMAIVALVAPEIWRR